MHVVVIQPVQGDTAAIEAVSAQHDPYHGVVAPHVTLVFPIPSDAVDESALAAHVDAVARATPPFPVELSELELSWDQWLFLTPGAGRAQLIALHDALYRGPLEGFLRRDLPFVPHVALGHFGEAGRHYDVIEPHAGSLDEPRYRRVREELAHAPPRVRYTATHLDVVILDDAITRSSTVARVVLAGS